ncbi:hypothetical protein SAMN05880570_0788 [Paenibacillus sp. RU4T]|nr:hypothetical protein SAMN05880555_0789 [Paenibacillus sp. RU4X]SIQ35704.1 hypothetical protein SAMN05880570_0788 [Paenibacillus sp. RU4T]
MDAARFLISAHSHINALGKGWSGCNAADLRPW